MVPHEHHGELSSQEDAVFHSANECICGWLQIVFHEDLGAGHLENYVQGEGLNSEDLGSISNGPSHVFAEYALFELENQETTLVIIDDPGNIDYSSLYLRLPDTLRGPPKHV